MVLLLAVAAGTETVLRPVVRDLLIQGDRVSCSRGMNVGFMRLTKVVVIVINGGTGSVIVWL